MGVCVGMIEGVDDPVGFCSFCNVDTVGVAVSVGENVTGSVEGGAGCIGGITVGAVSVGLIAGVPVGADPASVGVADGVADPIGAVGNGDGGIEDTGVVQYGGYAAFIPSIYFCRKAAFNPVDTQ